MCHAIDRAVSIFAGRKSTACLSDESVEGLPRWIGSRALRNAHIDPMAGCSSTLKAKGHQPIGRACPYERQEGPVVRAY
jgi:hypothetical protein